MDRGLGAACALPDADGDVARRDGVVAEDLAPVAANSATASRSVQSGMERAKSRRIVAWSWSGKSSSVGPGASGRVPARVSAEKEPGWSSTATWATIPLTPAPARCAGPPPSVGEGRGVGGEVAQRVGGSLRVRRRRLAAVAQVVAHHASPPGGEPLAECIGPGEHRRPAC